jgi:hypothetical protein
VRFYNLPVDVGPFEAFAVGENLATIIRDTAPTAEPAAVPTLQVDPGDPFFFHLLIVRIRDLPNVRWRYLPTHNVWTVDKNSSPVIEYLPGYRRDGQPAYPLPGAVTGRMWFQTSRWEAEQLVHAEPSFVAWATRLFRWIKKHWVLIDDNYASPDAAMLWRAMWRTVLEEPCEGTGGDQIARWQRDHDSDNVLPRDAVHIAISRTTRDRPRWLTISIRNPETS